MQGRGVYLDRGFEAAQAVHDLVGGELGLRESVRLDREEEAEENECEAQHFFLSESPRR